MCLDKLSHTMNEAIGKGNQLDLKAGRKGPIISHLMFVDDLLLFCKATRRQMECVKKVLKNFYDMSYQQINIEKY